MPLDAKKLDFARDGCTNDGRDGSASQAYETLNRQTLNRLGFMVLPLAGFFHNGLK